MKRSRNRHYTIEFKTEAVQLAKTSEKPAAQVAKDLGIPVTTLYDWMHQADADAGEGPSDKPTISEKEELARLRRENERLRQERDFLKKAAAFFAKDGI